jgi:hypothetical protein
MAFLDAAVPQIVMNTFYPATFGNHPGLVGFHLAIIAIYGVLLIRARPGSLGFLTADRGLVVTALQGHPEVLSGHHSSLD